MQEAKFVPCLLVALGEPTNGSVSLFENGRNHVSHKVSRPSSGPKGEKMSPLGIYLAGGILSNFSGQKEGSRRHGSFLGISRTSCSLSRV